VFTSVAGRAVVVTGGTRGIGKGIARVFAQAGARILIVGRNAEAGSETAKELSLGERDISFLAADVATREGCTLMASIAVERLGGIDILCANAGIFPEKRLADMSDDDLDLVLDTNLGAVSSRSKPASTPSADPAGAESS
jgi:3-oxoacyl-[acyl-carrier protein] reductase